MPNVTIKEQEQVLKYRQDGHDTHRQAHQTV